MPLTVKYGMSKLTIIGGRLSGSSRLESKFTSFDRGQSKMCTTQIFLASGERFDFPNKRLLFWCVLDISNITLELWSVCIFWNRDNNLHIVRIRSSLELRFGLYWKHLLLTYTRFEIQGAVQLQLQSI
jgi:hypothetical protein